MTRFRFPVLYRHAATGRARIGLADFEIPDVSLAEAPLALRGFSSGTTEKTTSFHLHDGRLYGRWTEDRPKLHTVEGFRALSEVADDVFRSPEYSDFHANIFIDDRIRYGRIQHLAAQALRDDDAMSPDFLASDAGRAVLNASRDAIVLDGQVVRRSPGPLAIVEDGRLKFQGGLGLLPWPTKKTDMFALRELPEALALFDGFEVVNAPEVLIEVDDGFDSLPHALEGAAWNILVDVARRHLGDVTPDQARSVLELRIAVEARTGPCDYAAGGYLVSKRSQQDYDIPDAGDLLPALQACLESGLPVEGRSRERVERAVRRAEARLGLDQDLAAMRAMF